MSTTIAPGAAAGPGAASAREQAAWPRDRYRARATTSSWCSGRPTSSSGELARRAVAGSGLGQATGGAWQAFARRLSFASAEPGATASLTAAIKRAERAIGGTPGRLFHLAVPPTAFQPTVTMLGDAGLAPGSRVVIEKPFGTDLASARALNRTLHAIFDESQVFRIDHFLGKESVGNILAFRFAKTVLSARLDAGCGRSGRLVQCPLLGAGWERRCARRSVRYGQARRRTGRDLLL